MRHTWNIIKTRLGLNELNGDRKTQIWSQEGGKHKTWGTQVWHYSPLPNGAGYTIQRGGGGGALEASRYTETGQDRRPPGQRPFRDPRRSGELGQPWRVRGLGRPWRSRRFGAPWRILGLRHPWRNSSLWRPWRSRGFRRPWRDRLRGRGPSPRPGLYGWSPTTPPKEKKSLGKVGARSGTWGHSGGVDTWGGALEARTLGGARL